MANIIIPFDNKNYPIDEASLSTASAALRTHLSSVMNGTGSTINFGGTSYNIDSAKLSNARNAFISHLGTVAGNGYKVVVNGVEYNVDSAKMTSAVADLNTVLSGLQSGGNGDSNLIDMNQYGFYFGVPYSATMDVEGTIRKVSFTFYEDGSAKVEPYIDGVLLEEECEQIPAGTFAYGYHEILAGTSVALTVNSDGTQLTEPDGTVLTLESSTPPSSDGETVIFEEQTVTVGEDTIYLFEEAPFALIEGKTYVVVWDGVRYESVCLPGTDDDFGSGALYVSDSEKSFGVVYIPFELTGANAMVMIRAISGDHTLAVYKIN